MQQKFERGRGVGGASVVGPEEFGGIHGKKRGTGNKKRRIPQRMSSLADLLLLPLQNISAFLYLLAATLRFQVPHSVSLPCGPFDYAVLSRESAL